MQDPLYSNAQKFTIRPQTFYGHYDYVFEKQDEQIFNFIKEKYRYGNHQFVNKKCPWQERSLQDIRRQFIDLVKAIAPSKTNSVQNSKTNQQRCNHTQIISTLQNYLELLINNKFQQADNIIAKCDFTQCSQLQKKLNSFSLKMLKYQAIVQQNNKNKYLSGQVDFYHKVIQNMNEHKSLQHFIAMNKKSPYMLPTLSYKLQRQLILSQEKQEYQKICKGYEKVLLELNSELRKPLILQFKNTNIELSNFSCKDFKSKLPEQSGIRLKKSLAELIYNISSSKDKKIQTESQKSSSIKSDNQTWTYYLLNHFLTIVSNEFEQKHFNQLKYFVIDKIPNNKTVADVLDRIEYMIGKFVQIKEFEKVLGGLSVTNATTIDNALSMIKPKDYNTQKMSKLFRRQLIYKLMHEIHSDKIVTGNFTLIQSLLNNYKKYINQSAVKSIEKLSLKTGKERKALQDLRTTLHEIQVFTGSNHIATINKNPNTTDFYLQLHTCASEIYKNLNKTKNYQNEGNEGNKTLNRNSVESNQLQYSQNNYNQRNSNQDITLVEQNLNHQIDQYKNLKKKLLEVFSSFEKDFSKNVITSYISRGDYHNLRECLSSYVNKKTAQIKEITKQFDETENLTKSNTDKVPKKKIQIFQTGSKSYSTHQIQSVITETKQPNEQYSGKDKNIDLIQKLNKQIQTLKNYIQKLNSTIQDKNKQIIEFTTNRTQLQTTNKKLLQQIEKRKIQLQGKQNETANVKKLLKETEQNLKVVTQSHDQLLLGNNSKILELNNQLTRLSEFEKLYNDLKVKVSQMKIDSKKQKDNNTKQLASIQDFWNKFEKQKQIINQLEKSNQSIGKELTDAKKTNQLISKELAETKKKSTSQTYLMNEHQNSLINYQFKIQQLQKTTRQQQDQIKTLKEQLQSKKSNAFKRQDEGDQKRSGTFRSLKEPDQNPRQSGRSISRQKQQLQGLGSKPSQEVISKKELELKIIQNSQKLKQQFQTELAKQLSTQKSQFANQKQTLEQTLAQSNSDLKFLGDQNKLLGQQKQKQIQRAEGLQQLKTTLEQQIAELKQQKYQIEGQLNNLRQLLAKQEEQTKKKKQQEERFSTDENNNKELLKNQINQLLTQVQQLKTNISQLQANLVAEKSKISQLQNTIQLSNQQKAAYLEEKQKKQQLAKQQQQKIKQMQELHQNLEKKIQQLIVKLADAKNKQSQPKQSQPKQSQPIVEKPKGDLISEYEWKISSLTHELKLKQEECDELGGFDDKKVKPKRAHTGVQTDNIGEEVKNVKQSSLASDQNVLKNGQVIAQQQVKAGEQAKIQEKEQQKIEQSLPIDQSVNQQQSTNKLQQLANQSHNLEQERQFIANDIPSQSENPNQPTQLTLQQQKLHQNHTLPQSVQTQTQPNQLDLPQQLLNESLLNQDTFLTQTHDNVNKSAMQQSVGTAHMLRVETKQYEEKIDKLTTENVNLNREVDKLKMSIQQHVVGNKTINQKLALTENKLGQLQAKNTLSVKNYQKLLDQFEYSKNLLIEAESKLNNQIEQHQSTISALNQQLESLKVTISQLDKQILSKQTKLHQSQEITAQLTKNLEKTENDLIFFKQQFTNKQLLLKQAQEKIAELIKQKQNYGPDMDVLKSQVKDYEYTIQELRGTNNQQRAQITQLKNKIKTLNDQAKQAKKFAAQQIRKVKLQASRQLNEAIRQKSNLQFQILQRKQSGGSSSNSASKAHLQLENDKLKKDLNKLQSQMSSYQYQSNNLNKKIKQLEGKLKDKQHEMDDLYHNLNATSLSLKQMQQTAYSSTPNPNNFQKPISKYLMFDRLFPGEILQDQHQKKYLLSNTIQKRLHMKISKTKLLYKYDPLNPASFHNYIDGKQNFLIIIRTINDRLFGAFSTQKFLAKSKQSQFSESFIFSFNPQTKQPISCFNLMRNVDKARSLTYDDFFLIVGNSEIRWKMGEKTIYSNFGITNSYFDPRGTNVEVLLQLGEERETNIKGFECFQVCFEK